MEEIRTNALKWVSWRCQGAGRLVVAVVAPSTKGCDGRGDADCQEIDASDLAVTKGDPLVGWQEDGLTPAPGEQGV